MAERTGQIHVRGPDGAWIFQGYQLDGGPEWHVSAAQWTGVMIAGNAALLCKLVGSVVSQHNPGMCSIDIAFSGGKVFSSGEQYMVSMDAMNCAEVDGRYMSYADALWLTLQKQEGGGDGRQ